MKTTKILITLLLLGNFAFKSADNEVEKCLIKIGETISFSNKPFSEREITSTSMSKGSYDGSGFRLKIDTAKNITLSEISQSKGPKQDEFIIVGCTGIFKRDKDNLIIQFEKYRKNYYLVNLDSSYLVGIFDTIISIRLISEQLNGKPAEYYCHEKDRTGIHQRKVIPGSNDNSMEASYTKNISSTLKTIRLTAVPLGIKNEELYAAKHPINSLAHFTKIEVALKSGKIIPLQHGSYILCEGNSFNLK